MHTRLSIVNGWLVMLCALLTAQINNNADELTKRVNRTKQDYKLYYRTIQNNAYTIANHPKT